MSSDRDIYQILESLDAAQRSVKQLPALFRPAQTSPQLDGPYPGRNATRGYMVGEDRYNHENPMARAVHISIINQHPEWIVKYGTEELMQAIEDVVDEGPVLASEIQDMIRMIGDILRDRKGSREEMDRRRPFAEQDGRDDDEEEIDDDGMTMADRARRDGRGGDEEDEQDVEEGFMDTIKGAAKEFTRDSLQRKIKQAWENTFWPKHIEPALNRITIDGQPFRRMVLGEPRVIENDRSQRAILKQYTVNIVFPIDPRQWENDEIQYLEGQLRDIEDGDWNPKVHGLGLVSFDQPMKSFQYTRGKTPDLVIPVRITSLDINRGLVSEQGVSEGKEAATEDILSAVKARLGDYIQDVATAIKKDPDLLDKLPDSVDQIRAVKTIKTDDGHEIKILGNEDDGFRISIKNNKSNSKFSNLDEAVMAVEMFCARRRSAAESADYIEEKQ